MSTVVFYHYTDKGKKDSIIRSGTIYASSSGAYGPGVYGTRISPYHGRREVSKNNWDAGEDWKIAEGQGRADCAFKICIPVRKVKEAADSKRDILIHKGNIRLSDYRWELLECPRKSSCTFLSRERLQTPKCSKVRRFFGVARRDGLRRLLAHSQRGPISKWRLHGYVHLVRC